MRKVSLLILLTCGFVSITCAQKIAVKTNLFYGAYTYTPNLNLEIGIGNYSTIDIGGGYNPWNRDGTEQNNKKRVHWLGNIEYRYWLCQKFYGHFFGVHALASQYNLGQLELPLLFGKGSRNFRYEGYAIGSGISYGYQWILDKRWNLEANIGVGYIYLNYDKYDCQKCGQKVGSYTRNNFLPTKAGISLIYTF